MPLIKIEPKVEVQIPAGTLERIEAKVEKLWWAGFCGGVGLGLALAIVAFGLWLRGKS